MNNQKKVVKFKKRRGINIGVIVFFVLFVYIAANVYIYFTKDKLTIYEVHEGTTAIENRITALVLREEKIIYSEEAGYISYFQKEGARVSKNASVYSIDNSGQMYDVATSGDIPVTISKKNYAEFKHEIKSFLTSFSNSNYSKVYEFKDDAQSTVLDILNNVMISQGQAFIENGITSALHMVPSVESGIVSYNIDNFETVTPEAVSEEMFNKENYKKTSLRASEMVAQGSPVYKLITSETWNLIVPLTTEQYQRIADQDTISINIVEDDFDMKAKLSFISRGTTNYAKLTLNRNMSNYLNERYLDIELNFNSIEGLKIPLTSIVQKDCYVVPNSYFTQGADSKDAGLAKVTFDPETGEEKYPFVHTDIYYRDENNSYIDASLFTPGTWVQSTADASRYQLNEIKRLTGVYNVNQGYAVFKYIEILHQNDEYCIISKNTKYGLSAYDHIALDSSTAVEQKIIY